MTEKSDRGSERTVRRRAAPARRRVRLREFSQSLPMALMRTRESVMAHFRPTLRRHDVTEQQWRVLRALNSAGEQEVTELALSACLLGPSLTRILKDLEERGLISRRSVARDLRRSEVSITPAGVRLIEDVAPESEAIYAEISRRFGADRLAHLLELLQELEDVMRFDLPDEGAPQPAPCAANETSKAR
jgi:homoprotocatechuate degradation regulator HpaR